MEQSMEQCSEGNADAVGELIEMVRVYYPNANMIVVTRLSLIVVDIWRTFPPMYTIYSGEPHTFKDGEVNVEGYNMGFGDSPEEAWERALDTAKEVMLSKLCE
jgi:hypothetical protein